MPKLVLYGGLVLLLGALVGCGWLFWVQNSLITVTTSFEFWGVGRIGATLPVTHVIARSAAAGVVVGAVPFLALWARSSAEARRLRRQVAVGSSDSSSFR